MKQQTKAIQIDVKIHKQLKKHCDDNGLKMQKLVEKIIINEIEHDRDLQNNKPQR
jgi:hypothetical protein